MKEELSPAARRLLLEQIESHEKLQVLGLLHADQHSNGPSSRTVEDMAAQLHIRRQAVEDVIRDLQMRGLVQRAPGGPRQPAAYRYGTARPEVATAVDELVRVHREHPVVTLKALADHSIDRIRGAALRAFADAFDLNKRKK
jgi:predicted ArsR family transcriptional regulator